MGQVETPYRGAQIEAMGRAETHTEVLRSKQCVELKPILEVLRMTNGGVETHSEMP